MNLTDFEQFQEKQFLQMIEKCKLNGQNMFKCFCKVINLGLCSYNSVKNTGYP